MVGHRRPARWRHGAQSARHQCDRPGPPEFHRASTTYLTGTLTTLVIRLATGHRFREVAHHLLLLGGLIGGAALAALLTHHAPTLAQVTQLVPLGAVLGVAGWQGHERQAAPE